jgi:hypothetical protein
MRVVKVVLCGLVCAVLLAPTLWGIARFWSGARPDPRFNIENVRGLTPDQVIARFGPPRVDPRRPEEGGWTPTSEPTSGPLVFNYVDHGSWMGWEHSIFFEDGKVSRVQHGSK